MRKQKEKFLLYRIREHRDEQAFAQLHKEHAQHVYRFLCSKLPSQEDAHDALSTTFLRLWNYLQTSHVDHVSALIFTIARGVVSEFYRENEIETQSLDNEDAGLEADDEGVGAKDITNDANVALVKKAMDELPNHYREVVLLKYFEGMSTKDIANHLDKSDNATRVMVHRAIKKIRKILEDKTS